MPSLLTQILDVLQKQRIKGRCRLASVLLDKSGEARYDFSDKLHNWIERGLGIPQRVINAKIDHGQMIISMHFFISETGKILNATHNI